jgi:hypothetical protein
VRTYYSKQNRKSKEIFSIKIFGEHKHQNKFKKINQNFLKMWNIRAKNTKNSQNFMFFDYFFYKNKIFKN